jgi:hypothetical protein
MQPSAPARKIERQKASDHREVFSNFAEIKYTVNDFLLRFSVIRDSDAATVAGTVVITNVLDVACSPQNAKSLLRAVGNLVAAYEKQYGPIPEEPTPAGPVN